MNEQLSFQNGSEVKFSGPGEPDGLRSAVPTCYACGRELDSLRVTWAHRDGALRPMHRACVRPTPRVHGVVVR